MWVEVFVQFSDEYVVPCENSIRFAPGEQELVLEVCHFDGVPRRDLSVILEFTVVWPDELSYSHQGMKAGKKLGHEEDVIV